jgi:hypothetical protein
MDGLLDVVRQGIVDAEHFAQHALDAGLPVRQVQAEAVAAGGVQARVQRGRWAGVG